MTVRQFKMVWQLHAGMHGRCVNANMNACTKDHLGNLRSPSAPNLNESTGRAQSYADQTQTGNVLESAIGRAPASIANNYSVTKFAPSAFGILESTNHVHMLTTDTPTDLFTVLFSSASRSGFQKARIIWACIHRYAD